MADFHWKLILIAIILNCSFSQSLANQPTETQNGQSHTSGRTEDVGLADAENCGDPGECEDSEQRFSQNLQNNYLDGFLHIEKFFKSTNSVLEKINDRLAGLEKDNRRFDISLNRLDPEYYVESLSPAAKGASFQGLTTDQIAAAIPHDDALAVEIVNFLDKKLTDYQLDLPHGLEHQKAPKIVFPNSSEIFTFKQNGQYLNGVLFYRIGNTGFSLHLFFLVVGRTIAAAFMENRYSVRTLLPIDSLLGCSSYTHTASPGTFKCIWSWDGNTKKTFVIHKDSVYAKLNVDFKDKSSILKIEVFKFGP